MRFQITMLFVCLLFCFSCGQKNRVDVGEEFDSESKRNLSGNFSISGAYALFPLVQKWAGDFMTIYPDVKIVVYKAGTGQGIEDLISGKNQLAMTSRPLNDKDLEAGIWSVTVAKDGVAPIVNQKNPYIEQILSMGLSPDEYIKVFTSERPVTWGELINQRGEEKVVTYIREDESGAADVFANFIFKESSDLKGIKVTGDDEMIKSVQGNIYAIGFCNFSYAFDVSTGERIEGIQIIPSDLDFDNVIDRKELPFNNLEASHRGVWLGIYPKNLCRELAISSVGKPSDPIIVEFLRYILTDGQNDVKATGLCELNDFYIKYGLEKLN